MGKNLHSLKLVLDQLSNTYIVPCDIWCECNLFQKHEIYSWYMVRDLADDDSEVHVNRKMELVTVLKTSSGNTMLELGKKRRAVILLCILFVVSLGTSTNALMAIRSF